MAYHQGQIHYMRCEVCGYLERVLPDTLERAKWLAYCHQTDIQSIPCEAPCGFQQPAQAKKHVVHIEEIIPMVTKEHAVLPPCIRGGELKSDHERLEVWFEEHGVKPA